jgi:tetratricopeptide (TPR) repeat protein
MRLPPIVLAPLIALAALSQAAHAQTPDSAARVGRRVVIQNGALLNDPQAGRAGAGPSRKLAAARERSALRVCTVEFADGTRLWLRDEDGPAQGWVDASWTIPFDRAVDFFTAQIRAEPAAAVNYIHRAAIREKRGELVEAVADLDDAIRLDPRGASAHADRGRVRSAMRELDKAVADYTEAVRIDPDFAVAYKGRGSVRDEKTEYGRALADFDQAIRIDPEYAHAYNDRAWLRATCPEAMFRDGKAAVADATKACELDGWRDPDLVDTLAAAHAETGAFARAIEVQQKALALVKDQARAGSYRERLALYQAGKPYRGAAVLSP